LFKAFKETVKESALFVISKGMRWRTCVIVLTTLSRHFGMSGLKITGDCALSSRAGAGDGDHVPELRFSSTGCNSHKPQVVPVSPQELLNKMPTALGETNIDMVGM
jgi:hypothetical protein